MIFKNGQVTETNAGEIIDGELEGAFDTSPATEKQEKEI